MWGNGIRSWFELFAGIVIYRVTDQGPDSDDGWINVSEIENRFSRERLLFGGKPYDPSDQKQRNALLESIISNASLLCSTKLLERRRTISPPSLAYHVTRLGRKVDSWGYGNLPGFRKRLLFFMIELIFRSKKHWKLVTIGAVGWAVLNAVKFYGMTFEWLREDFFAVVTALAVVIIAWLVALIWSKHG